MCVCGSRCHLIHPVPPRACCRILKRKTRRCKTRLLADAPDGKVAGRGERLLVDGARGGRAGRHGGRLRHGGSWWRLGFWVWLAACVGVSVERACWVRGAWDLSSPARRQLAISHQSINPPSKVRGRSSASSLASLSVPPRHMPLCSLVEEESPTALLADERATTNERQRRMCGCQSLVFGRGRPAPRPPPASAAAGAFLGDVKRTLLRARLQSIKTAGQQQGVPLGGPHLKGREAAGGGGGGAGGAFIILGGGAVIGCASRRVGEP